MDQNIHDLPIDPNLKKYPPRFRVSQKPDKTIKFSYEVIVRSSGGQAHSIHSHTPYIEFKSIEDYKSNIEDKISTKIVELKLKGAHLVTVNSTIPTIKLNTEISKYILRSSVSYFGGWVEFLFSVEKIQMSSVGEYPLYYNMSIYFDSVEDYTLNLEDKVTAKIVELKLRGARLVESR